MLDGFPQPVILAGDINRMASRARELGNVAKALRQSGGAVQGLAPRESEVELDEPCVMALYSSPSSTPGGFGLGSCYGVRPPDLVGGREGDPHHAIYGILTISREALEALSEIIKHVRSAATQQRLLGWVAQVQRQRERSNDVAGTR